jgi:hypothetical protein
VPAMFRCWPPYALRGSNESPNRVLVVIGRSRKERCAMHLITISVPLVLQDVAAGSRHDIARSHSLTRPTFAGSEVSPCAQATRTQYDVEMRGLGSHANRLARCDDGHVVLKTGKSRWRVSRCRAIIAHEATPCRANKLPNSTASARMRHICTRTTRG